MAKKKLYDETSIESLDPREFTRLRAGVYCGDTAYATQLLVEIVSNAVDEFRLGNGNKIEVNINKEIVSVRDYGQGFITNHFRDDGKTILEAAFSVINTSGKYREDGTYEGTSLGSFGIGSKLTNFLSNWLIVETYRDGKFEKIKFDEGLFAEREVGEDTKSKTGTLVKWKASKEFFTNPIVEIEKVKSLFKTITCLCPGLTIELNNNKEKITYFSKNGLDDLVFVKTIYIGGGTPSYIDSKYIKEIIEEIKTNFKVSKDTEVTIEINPGTVDKQKLLDYMKSGINRVSIGLQSTDDDILRKIGRIHKYDDFLQTYNMAREVGFKNINVDLMLALPGQTVPKLKQGLKQIIALKPEHISLYSLILEEGTVLNKKVQNKEIELPDEDDERKMYWETKRILEEAGYIHYEISNFAKKGYESKHNLDCWNQKEYMGFGASAHSYTNNVRFSNIDSIEDYITNYKNDNVTDNFIFLEKQNPSSQMKEYMMLGLRKIDGISIQEFKNKFVGNPLYIYRNELEKLVKEQLIEIELDRIKLTEKGLDFANIVWEEFI